MRSPSVLGLVAGLASAGLSVTTYVRRGEPQFESLAPDALSLIVIIGLMATAGIAAARRNPSMARREAWHATFVAAGAFAVAMAAFTRFFLPQSGPLLGSVMALIGIVLVSLAGAVAGRSPARGPRHA